MSEQVRGRRIPQDDVEGHGRRVAPAAGVRGPADDVEGHMPRVRMGHQDASDEPSDEAADKPQDDDDVEGHAIA